MIGAPRIVVCASDEWETLAGSCDRSENHDGPTEGDGWNWWRECDVVLEVGEKASHAAEPLEKKAGAWLRRPLR
jgi:hypothetical protein